MFGYSNELSNIEKLKISCFSRGIKLTTKAKRQISLDDTRPISIHEYVTTGGITFKLEKNIFINAPFDEWFCDNPEVCLDVDPLTGQYTVEFLDEVFPAQILPLPGYLEQYDESGYRVRETSMSHADRLRISPIYGCSFGCDFCDFKQLKYTPRSAEQIISSMNIALQDRLLPIKHILISGGTPSPKDYEYYEAVCIAILNNTTLPVDVMLAPWSETIIEKLINRGTHGFSINVEIFDRALAQKITKKKWGLGLAGYEKSITKAIEKISTPGRVRSLLIVGLEPLESTLEGVRFLAKLGCDPVLSPFRPGVGTPLQHITPPSAKVLERVYLESVNIAARYDVKLGPRCIPCQHNTLTFPDNSGDYFLS
jgi:hypothetical protein